jgi:hypothetical protein
MDHESTILIDTVFNQYVIQMERVLEVPGTCCMIDSGHKSEDVLSLVVLVRFDMETRRCVFSSGGRSWKRDSREIKRAS